MNRPKLLVALAVNVLVLLPLLLIVGVLSACGIWIYRIALWLGVQIYAEHHRLDAWAKSAPRSVANTHVSLHR